MPSLSGDKAFSSRENNVRASEPKRWRKGAREGGERERKKERGRGRERDKMSKPANISCGFREPFVGATNNRSIVRRLSAEASLAASSRAKKAKERRRRRGKKKKGEKNEQLEREKRIARANGLRILSSPAGKEEKERSLHAADYRLHSHTAFSTCKCKKKKRKKN